MSSSLIGEPETGAKSVKNKACEAIGGPVAITSRLPKSATGAPSSRSGSRPVCGPQQSAEESTTPQTQARHQHRCAASG
jgi:hypothetical protein